MKGNNKKQEYKHRNEEFLNTVHQREGIIELRGGVLCEYILKGNSEVKPGPRSIVTCHYKGSLIPCKGDTEGHVFDETFTSCCPSAFRVNELIPGFQIALVNMCVGDHCRVYIPSDLGYGSRGVGNDIPGNSTLIFEIKLIAVG